MKKKLLRNYLTLILVFYAFEGHASKPEETAYSVNGDYQELSTHVYERAREKWKFNWDNETSRSVRIKENKKKKTNAVLIYEFDSFRGKKVILFTMTFEQTDDMINIGVTDRASKLYDTSTMHEDLKIWISEYERKSHNKAPQTTSASARRLSLALARKTTIDEKRK